MPDPNTFTVRLDSLVGPVRLEVRHEPPALWVAQVFGYDSCVADGITKDDAIRQAVVLYLHVKIAQIHRGNWAPRYRKETS